MSTNTEKQRNKATYLKRMARKNIKFIIILFSIPLLVVLGRFILGTVYGIVGVNIPYSEGERTVKIIKLAQTGVFWKTWEAEGVLIQDNFSVTYIFKFSVDNDDSEKERLVNDIKTAFENGQTVKIKYDQRLGSVPWRSQTSYFIKEVRF